jgi:hypothetical protein
MPSDALRPRSRASLSAALVMLGTPGASGTLVIQIPHDPDKPCELIFVTGPAELTIATYKL